MNPVFIYIQIGIKVSIDLRLYFSSELKINFSVQELIDISSSLNGSMVI